MVKDVPYTRSVYAERVNTGYFIDIEVKRQEAARYGLTVDDVKEIIQSSIGGMTQTIPWREGSGIPSMSATPWSCEMTWKR